MQRKSECEENIWIEKYRYAKMVVGLFTQDNSVIALHAVALLFVWNILVFQMNYRFLLRSSPARVWVNMIGFDVLTFLFYDNTDDFAVSVSAPSPQASAGALDPT